jgi:peptidoglycan/LPS O-acetylase OafA/YrhL
MRDNNFDAIRLLAAIMVLSGHTSALMKETILLLGTTIENLGVITFFLIGGYLITQSFLHDSNFISYGIKRFFRLIPPLAVYTVVAALAVGPLLSTIPVSEYFRQPGVYRYLLNIILLPFMTLPGVFENNPYPFVVNGSLWVMPVEALMYVVMPVVISLAGLKRKTRASHLVLAIVCGVVCAARVSQLAFAPDLRIMIMGKNFALSFDVIPFFFIGSLFVIPEMRKLCNVQAALVLFILFACFRAARPVNMAGLFVIYSYFVFSLAFAPRPVFAHKLEKYECSYSLFLYGCFIQQIVIQVEINVGLHVNAALNNLICIVIAAVVAWFSFKFVERPSQKLCKALLRKINEPSRSLGREGRPPRE